jgi:hypothetical protein
MHGAIPIAPCLAAQRRGSSEKNRPGPLDPSCVGLLRLVNQSMGPDDNIDAIDRFPQQIRDAHRASINHRAQIECSDRCGCFHCGALFQPKEIEHWVDEGPDGRGTTAMCPRCDIAAYSVTNLVFLFLLNSSMRCTAIGSLTSSLLKREPCQN